MKRLDVNDNFLRYSAVIGQCYTLSGENSLGKSVEYGRRSGLLDNTYNMSPLGSLVGNIILRTYDCG